jgi:(1->4)-alpha-D-glucan 1-alpha-D-glucosylmutase
VTLGLINSLAQLTLKIGSPGVADFYQGTEFWDLSLVDPDNRRPIDFARRAHAMDDVDGVLALDAEPRATRISAYVRSWTDGHIKLLVTAAGLRLRRDLPEVFLDGAYVPLQTEVTVPGSALGFARISPGQQDAALFVAPRLCRRLMTPDQPLPLGADCWRTSRLMLPPSLSDREFRDVVTGASIRPTRGTDTAWIFLGEAFRVLPMAILRAV